MHRTSGFPQINPQQSASAPTQTVTLGDVGAVVTYETGDLAVRRVAVSAQRPGQFQQMNLTLQDGNSSAQSQNGMSVAAQGRRLFIDGRPFDFATGSLGAAGPQSGAPQPMAPMQFAPMNFGSFGAQQQATQTPAGVQSQDSFQSPGAQGQQAQGTYQSQSSSSQTRGNFQWAPSLFTPGAQPTNEFTFWAPLNQKK